LAIVKLANVPTNRKGEHSGGWLAALCLSCASIFYVERRDAAPVLAGASTAKPIRVQEMMRFQPSGSVIATQPGALAIDALEKVAIGSSNLVEIWFYDFVLLCNHAVHSIALNADSDTLVVGTAQTVEVYDVVRTLHFREGLERAALFTGSQIKLIQRVQPKPCFSVDPRTELHEYSSHQGEVAISEAGKVASAPPLLTSASHLLFLWQLLASHSVRYARTVGGAMHAVAIDCTTSATNRVLTLSGRARCVDISQNGVLRHKLRQFVTLHDVLRLNEFCLSLHFRELVGGGLSGRHGNPRAPE
jgi:hypothetical protein